MISLASSYPNSFLDTRPPLRLRTPWSLPGSHPLHDHPCLTWCQHSGFFLKGKVQNVAAGTVRSGAPVNMMKTPGLCLFSASFQAGFISEQTPLLEGAQGTPSAFELKGISSKRPRAGSHEPSLDK